MIGKTCPILNSAKKESTPQFFRFMARQLQATQRDLLVNKWKEKAITL